MNKKLLALYGLKWNPFAPDVPAEALQISPRIESFCWRVEQLAGEGGFALVTGSPGLGKSVTLRLLAERLAGLRDVQVGVLSRPQAGMADFYREMGELFGVELHPHNRYNGAKLLRTRWQGHIDASLCRPVLIADEGQEMQLAVLNELRLLCSARLDSHLLLTVVLAGDQRLIERFRAEELLPLGSRMRVRLALDRSSPEELQECLRHALQKAGATKLMTPELIATLSDHAQGNMRTLMNMAGELLALAAQREAPQIDEKLFFDLYDTPSPTQPKGVRSASMSALPVEQAYRLADRAEEQRWLVTGLWSEQAVGIVGGGTQVLQVLPRPGSGRRRRFRHAVPAPLRGAAAGPRAAVCGRGRSACRAPPTRGHLCRRGLRSEGSGRSRDHRPHGAPRSAGRSHASRAALSSNSSPACWCSIPFVRLHRIDENASGEVAPLLAYLRTLQRQHSLAVLVVHHARKSAGNMRAGQALRGSSEFHAWGDSNLYLRRSGSELNLTVEHRAAPSPPTIALELAQRGEALALEVVQSTAAQALRHRAPWTSASPPR